MSKKAKETKDQYSASVRVLGKVYTSSGDSVLAAVSNLAPGNARGMSIITVSHGTASRERILSPIRTTRLFNTRGLSREKELTQISTLFDL